MKNEKLLIVEDEPIIADSIAEALEEHGYEVIGIVDEAKEAREMTEKKKPDAILLDINIEGDTDGIAFASTLKIPFIFLTSYYDKATIERAKQTGPSGYIVKPFRKADLIANVEIALSRDQKSMDVAEKKSPQKLFVRNGQEIRSIMSDEIVYVASDDNYANVFTENEKFVLSHTLKSVEEKLTGHGFVRIHRSYLVNFSMIDSVREGFVFLKGHKVQIGKSYRKEFFENLAML